MRRHALTRKIRPCKALAPSSACHYNGAMPDRVLVIQPYGLGDAVFMLPFLKALRDGRQVERIDVILGHRTAEIVEGSGLVDGIFIIDKDIWKARGCWYALRDKLRLFLTARQRRYTVFVDLSMQPEYGFWAKHMLGIPLRAGFDYKRRNRFLNRPLHLPAGGFQGKNMIEFYADLADLLGCHFSDPKPRLPVSKELAASVVRDLLVPNGINDPYAVVSPAGGATWGQDARFKHWPAAHFVQLLRRLRQKGCFGGIVVLGAEHATEIGEFLKRSLEGPVANLCGKTSIMQAVALCKAARMFIGNDGGLVHLAATQDIPIVAFYGPADPLVYGPYPRQEKFLEVSKRLACQPCYKGFRYNKACERIPCLNDLAPADVLEEMQRRGLLC